MSKRNIVNNLNQELTVKYYVKDDQGKPSKEKELTIKPGDKNELDSLIDTCWLKFSIHKKDGCTVNLNGNQVLEQLTIKPVSSGGPNTETVVKISAKYTDPEDPADDDDIVINPPQQNP